jgi:hypothetical protein
MTIRKIWFKIWFWLTYKVQCSWCKRTIHGAWIPVPGKRLTRNRRLPRVSHGICPACFERMVVR